jgi:hypothetical protein
MGLSTSVSLAMMIAYLAVIPDTAFSFAPPTALVSKPAAFVSFVAAKSEASPVRYPLPTGRLFAESKSSADANDETDGSQEEETPVVEQPAAAAAPPAVPRAPPAPRAKRMDPLMASLTRDDSGSSGGDSKKMNVPLFGEVEVDGSLVVLAPAIVIGVVGFVMSINVALNSKDAISSSLSQYSESANNAAISRTNVVPGDGSCRGLCSSQESDLEGLRGFMTSISKNKKMEQVAATPSTPTETAAAPEASTDDS